MRGTTIVLIFFILLFGCTQLTQQEKNTCYSLASKSYSYVPVCETEQSCFEKAKELFKTNFDYALEDHLYLLTNDLARSWFFYNKGTSQLKKISAACKSGDVMELSERINDARDNFEDSFMLADRVLERSVIIVSLTETTLSEDEFDLTPEEGTYSSLLSLRQILTELQGAPTNSGSYAALYLRKTHEFNVALATKGYSYILTKENFNHDEFVSDASFRKVLLPGNELYFTPIKEGLDVVFEKAESLILKGGSLAELKRIPSSELMVLYSGLVGTRASAIERFSDLMNSTAVNYDQARKRKNDLFAQIQEEQSRTEKDIETYQSTKAYAVIFQDLARKVSKDFSPDESHTLTTQRVKELFEKDAKRRLSLGRALKESKDILQQFNQIQQVTRGNASSLETQLTAYCQTLAENYANTTTTSSTLSPLALSIRELSKKVIAAPRGHQYELCAELVDRKNEYVQAATEYATFEAKAKDATAHCFTNLTSIFQTVSLSELEREFLKLKNTDVTENNLLFFKEQCTLLTSQVEQSITEIYHLEPLFLAYEKTAGNLALLKRVSLKNNSTIFETREKQFAPIKEYFEKKDFIFLANTRDTLLQELEKLYHSTRTDLEKEIIEYSTKNKSIIFTSKEVPRTNTPTPSVATVFFPNPFEYTVTSFSTSLPIHSKEISSSDECLENAILGDTTILSFSCLPYGGVTLSIEGEVTIGSSESDTLIYASSERSVLKRDIVLQTPGEFPNVELITPLFAPTFSVMVNGNKTNGIVEGNDVHVYITNATAQSSIQILFYSQGLFPTTCELEKIILLSSERELLRYQCVVINTWKETVTPTLIFPTTITGAVLGSKVYGESLQIVSSRTAGSKLVVDKEYFLAFEKRFYQIDIESSSADHYYREQIEVLVDQLTNSTDAALRLRGKKLLEAEMGTNFLTDAQRFIKEAQTQITNHKQALEKQKQLIELSTALKNKISEGEAYTNQLRSLGSTSALSKIETELSLARAALTNNTSEEMSKALTRLLKITFDMNDAFLNSVKENIKYMKERVGENQALRAILITAQDQELVVERYLSLDPPRAIGAAQEISRLKNEFDALLENDSNLSTLSTLSAQIAIARKLHTHIREELSVEEQKLVTSKLLIPITRARLDALQLTLDNLPASDTPLTEKVDRVLKVIAELSTARASLKKQAILAYNAAIDEGGDTEKVSKAKSFLDENKFVSAYLILSADAFPPLPSLPFMYLVPLALLVGVGILIKKDFFKRKGSAEKNKEKVLAEWE